MTPQSLRRFHSRIELIPFHTCWEWLGDHNEKGYGRYNNEKAHRIAYRLYKGPVGRKHVLHTCDNPGCVNPAHLVLGTHTENMRDKVAKGRDFNKIKTHCRNGHAYAGSNLIVKKSGERRCRTCHIAQLRALRARRK